MTVTNDIEGVVKRLQSSGLLPTGRRLVYYDSEGNLTEACIEGTVVVGYRPVGYLVLDGD
jgi:hypothetical protein